MQLESRSLGPWFFRDGVSTPLHNGAASRGPGRAERRIVQTCVVH